MQVARTPDERFEALPDFSFAPHYVEIDDGEGGRLRVHVLGQQGGDGFRGVLAVLIRWHLSPCGEANFLYHAPLHGITTKTLSTAALPAARHPARGHRESCHHHMVNVRNRTSASYDGLPVQGSSTLQ